MKKRVEEMAELNPCFLEKLKKEQGVDSIFQTHYSQNLHLRVNFSKAISIVSKEQLTVKPVKTLINKDEPIFKVVFISNPLEQRNIFVMNVSLSHLVGDGYILYNLYKILDPMKEMKSLNRYRRLLKELRQSSARKCLKVLVQYVRLSSSSRVYFFPSSGERRII